jgi:hypothetical protein
MNSPYNSLSCMCYCAVVQNMCAIADNFMCMCVHVCAGDIAAPPTGAAAAPPGGQGDVAMEGGMFAVCIHSLHE